MRGVKTKKYMKSQIKYLKNLFYDILNDFGRVFVVVRYSDRTVIGNRGFSDDEKEKGMILVFTLKNHRSLLWTEDGSISVKLSFGVQNRLEECFIYCDDIVALYSPDARIKFDRWDVWYVDTVGSEETAKDGEQEESPASKVIQLDKFRK